MMALILKRIRSRRSFSCPTCRKPIPSGQRAFWSADLPGRIRCASCAEHLITRQGMQEFDGGLFMRPSKEATT